MNRFFYVLFALFLLEGTACHKTKQTQQAIKKPRGSLLVIGAPEGALLIIDEEETYPLSPKSRLSLTIGEHRVSIECDGYFPSYQTVTIKEKEEISIAVLLQPYMPD